MPPTYRLYEGAMTHVFDTAFNNVMIVITVMSLLGALLAFLLPGKPTTSPP